MRDEQTSAPNAARPGFRLQDLGSMKVTPLVFVAFFALLAVMSGAAAVVGYTVHRLAKPAQHHDVGRIAPRE